MSRRRVVLLGATGSIGRQACDVIERHPEAFELVAVTAGSNVDALEQVARRFGVAAVAITAPGAPTPDGWGVGEEAVCAVAATECDVVCVAITGAAALGPALAAIDAGRDIAIATKEVLVMAGDIVTARAAATGAQLLPVDSEHSALWQCLRGEDPRSVSRLLLTASGGPFRERELSTFGSITREQALQHPTWSMGPKVTIDSATMMNKGLEIIEAHHLFGIDYDRISVVIHPSSVVHSLVEFQDGGTMAQIGRPDMRVPIALALSGGRRLPDIAAPADLDTMPALCFEPLDPHRFPAPGLARRAGEAGGARPAVLNAANEAAVAAFLEGHIGYTDIIRLVGEVTDDPAAPEGDSLEARLRADTWARSEVLRRASVAQ